MSDYNHVPQPLKDLRNWVVWRYEDHGKKNPDGTPKLDKIPYDAVTGKKAKSNDRSTWCDFDTAVNAADIFSGNDYDGIGYELGGSLYTGFDFDGVIVEGKTEDYVTNILELFGSPYADISPSGTGVKTFVEGKLPEGFKHKVGEGHYGAEIYSTQYFTLTGQRHSGEGIPKLSPEQIEMMHFLCTQILDKEFKHLWVYGDGGKPHYGNDRTASGGDFQLLCKLVKAIPTTDPAVLDTYFRASARVKDADRAEKWERLGAQTIAKVLKNPAAAQDSSQSQPTLLEFFTANQVRTKKIKWLWEKRFAQKLNLLTGNPDVGKGLITHYIAACVTTGRDFFDAENTLPPSDVLILTAEEDWDDTAAVRLKAAGADLTRVHAVKGSVSLNEDLTQIDKYIDEHPAIRLLIVDPISNYMGQVSLNDEQRVRAVLTPLKELANRRSIAVVGVMHLNKKVELNAIHRIGGAMAFVGVARMVWVCAPKPKEDGTDSDEIIMVKVKGNIVQRKLKGLSFTTKVRAVDTDEDGEQMIPYVSWTGEVDQTADDITGNVSKKPAHRPADERQEAIAWLTEYLKDGAKPLADIEHVGKQLFNLGTLRRARKSPAFKTFVGGKQKAKDGKMRDYYSCELVPVHGVKSDVEVTVHVEGSEGLF
jgi:putative DNA primase/helicase